MYKIHICFLFYKVSTNWFLVFKYSITGEVYYENKDKVFSCFCCFDNKIFKRPTTHLEELENIDRSDFRGLKKADQAFKGSL